MAEVGYHNYAFMHQSPLLPFHGGYMIPAPFHNIHLRQLAKIMQASFAFSPHNPLHSAPRQVQVCNN